MYTDEQRVRMRELFRRKLEAKRGEDQPRHTASVSIADAMEEFPELDEHEVAALALEELYSGNWVPMPDDPGSVERPFVEAWFTDEAGRGYLEGSY